MRLYSLSYTVSHKENYSKEVTSTLLVGDKPLMEMESRGQLEWSERMAVIVKI